MKHALKLAPSVHAADFARLGSHVAGAERAEADRIHLDVMDSYFVPSLSMGGPVMASLRPVSHLPFEARLTISKRAGVVINPAPPAAVLEEILPEVAQVLVMTVHPGFGRWQFLHSTLARIGRVRRMIDRADPACDLAVDGGIDSQTALLCVEAGADVLVAGSSVFGTNESVPEAMQRLRTGEE